ncbi:MAG TPA: fused MFS/spermidine synthase [Rhodocyclaceae bacterium]|nr:fused MFS/spermidine synthase [Rhodocyclaceae bacterium]
MPTELLSQLLTFSSPFPEHPGTIRLLEPAGADAEPFRRQLLAATYPRPFLLENDSTRGLLFDLDYIQSSMRLDAPDALDLLYSHYMMAFLLFHTQVKTMVLLGLGGGSLAKYCYRHLPQVDLTAIEFNPDVIAFRRAFHLPEDDQRFRVIEADAALYVAADGPPFDVILMDAFDGRGVAQSVTQLSFYQLARQRLSKSGILVANISGESAERRAHLDLIREAFGDNLLVANVDDGSNHIIFAFRDPHFEPRWKWIASQAQAMKARFGLDLPKIAAEFRRNQERGWESVPI